MKKIKKNQMIGVGVRFFLVMLAAIFFISATVNWMPNLIEQVEAAPDSTLFFDPASLTVNLDEDFTLDTKINPGTNQVTAVELHITFDQTRFRLDSIVNGADFPVVFENFINNTNGTAVITVGIAAANPYVPITSESTVATFTFHSLVETSASSISIDNSSVAVAVGESTDVVTNRLPSIVTVLGRTYGNADFAALVADWLQTGDSPADVNSDNVVNTRDLGIMMNNWLP